MRTRSSRGNTDRIFSNALIYIKARRLVAALNLFMPGERAHDLAQLCTELVRKGNDFPTVWNTLLKGHALVDGIPQSKLEGNRPVLEIRLITGEQFVFDSKGRKFSVK